MRDVPWQEREVHPPRLFFSLLPHQAVAAATVERGDVLSKGLGKNTNNYSTQLRPLSVLFKYCTVFRTADFPALASK